jgi:hypothetical protein
MRKLSVAVLFALVLSSASLRAAEAYEWRFARVTTDILIARPFTFAATVLGGALWTVTLPITAPTRTAEESFDALVRQPFELTFDRELGEYPD